MRRYVKVKLPFKAALLINIIIIIIIIIYSPKKQHIWKQLASKQPGVMIWEFSKLVLNMTCASFILLIRVVDAWNILPNWIVMATSTGTNTFN